MKGRDPIFCSFHHSMPTPRIFMKLSVFSSDPDCMHQLRALHLDLEGRILWEGGRVTVSLALAF
jgi:hypothetical protein